MDQRIAASLDRYVGFGHKASGGAGDTACGEWLEDELRELGFAVERQAFSAPYLRPTRTLLQCEGQAPFDPIVQAPWRTTGPAGVEGRLSLLGPGLPPAARGDVGVAVLPHARWSTLQSPPIRAALESARQAQLAALILVTHGPSGEAIALNAPAQGQTPFPLLCVGSADGERLVRLVARGARARVVVEGEHGLRPAFNLLGRRERGGARRLVVSTPRSGWFTCAGERGGGVAAWLELARWASRDSALDLTFLCTSGHEYDNLGGHHYLASDRAPPSREVALWVHLGAAFAARDWHELGGRLMPLPGVDAQRFLMASPALAPALRRAFQGHPGLEAVYERAPWVAGELSEIFAAGYGSAFGVFGAHRYHHARQDDARCLSPGQVVNATKALLGAVRGLTA